MHSPSSLGGKNFRKVFAGGSENFILAGEGDILLGGYVIWK